MTETSTPPAAARPTGARPGGGDLPRIALLIETSTSWGRDLIRGIGEYARTHGPWLFSFAPMARSDRLMLPTEDRFDGVLARVNHEALRDQLLTTDVPCVDLSWFDHSTPEIARCTSDEHRIAELAFDYLRSCGHVSFAYCPPTGRPGYADRLGQVFERLVRDAGYPFRMVLPRPVVSHESDLADRYRKALTQTLKRLPRPTAVLAFSDVIGRLITECVREAGLRVPEDIAVLGAEQDELSSLLSVPELSTIDVGGDRVGYEAARLLDGLMNGEPVPPEPIRLPPVGVLGRASTDVLATNDGLVSSLCTFIRENIADVHQIQDLLERVTISRRSLEQRFVASVGKSPAAAIRFIRVQKARQLLIDSDKSIHQISIDVGFRAPEVMTRVFRSETGQTPSDYRDERRTHIRLHRVPSERLGDLASV